MKDLLFGIFDVKMKLFLSPFCARNVESALRQFCDACSRDDSMFKKHPEDFVLYELGVFDVESGSVSAIVPHAVGKALDFVPSAASAMRDALKETV